MYSVIAGGIDNAGDDESLKDALKAVQEEVRARFDVSGLEVDERVLAWRAAFKDFGADPVAKRPSLDGLLHRVLAGHEIPFVNKVVAISNIISLKHLLPSGGDDLVNINGDFGLRYANGMELFHPIGGSDYEHPEPNEVIYADDEKVLCRCWIWRQGERSKITDRSRFVAVNVDVLPPATPEQGQAAAEELATLIKQYCGGTTEIVSVGGESLSVTINSEVSAQLSRERLKDDSVRRLLDAHAGALTDSADMSQWSLKELLLRGSVEQVVVESELIARIDRGDRLTIYQGFDPTSPHLHVGHLVSLRVLRWFQLHGHRVIFLLGDATALIGDPSGRSEQREKLTHEKVKENMQTYKEQAGMVLEFEGGPNPVELKRNSDWLLSLTFADTLELMSRVTVQQLLERDMFQVRMKNKEPLYYFETIYPLLQGYDSVAMDVDAELGGRDQLFNMMMGRDLARSYLSKDKYVLTTPLLAGFDGRKMSKSYKNTVNLTATPFEIFDGIMRVKDELILQYARLLTNIPWSELAELEALLPDDPLAVKERVAFELVKLLQGEEQARAGREEFVKVRRAGTVPQEIPEARISASAGDAALVDVLVEATPAIVKSKGELRRLIRQGGVTLDGERLQDERARREVATLDGRVLRIGKDRFFRLVVG
jgi:tyrosyl-tRNA synthetase